MNNDRYILPEKLPLVIRSAKERLGTWQAVGDHFGINKTTAWKIANHNYIPKNPNIRRKLKLPEIVTHEQLRDEKGRWTKAL